MLTLSLEEFAKRLMAILPRLVREITRYENSYTTRGEITLPQVLALDHLMKQGPSPMSEIAKVMHLQNSSATGLVDRLIKKKWVKRLSQKEDRRVVKVVITPKGIKILKQIFKLKQKGVTEVFQSLSVEERSAYLEIIEKLYDHLSRSERQEERL